MAKTRGGVTLGSSSGKAKSDRVAQMKGKKYPKAKGIGETPSGEPIPLQTIRPQMAIPEEQSDVEADGSMHACPIVVDTSKTRNPSFDLLERVGSIDTLIKPAGCSEKVDKPMTMVDNDVIDDANHPGDEDVGSENVNVPEKVIGNNESINPSARTLWIKLKSNEYAKNHNFVDPTVAEISTGMNEIREGAARGRVVVDSHVVNKDDDDDVVVIFYTTSKTMKRIRSSVAALENKRAILGVGGVNAEVVKELEQKAEKLRAAKKGNAKAKRACVDKVGGFAPKKRKGVVISEPKSPTIDDKFIPNDVVDESEQEDVDNPQGEIQG
ncbi:hypothetical protein LIER_28501 [Lithospermum erythrorhizon]|uniref:Uncharacterized protein n=1 Tax=Lithospermum erythrorhizon TaxID=34254 RepID=A0AAV3RK00_LITER